MLAKRSNERAATMSEIKKFTGLRVRQEGTEKWQEFRSCVDGHVFEERYESCPFCEQLAHRDALLDRALEALENMPCACKRAKVMYPHEHTKIVGDLRCHICNKCKALAEIRSARECKSSNE